MGNEIKTGISMGSDSITELPTFVEQKSKQTAQSNTPVPMLLPINDLP